MPGESSVNFSVLHRICKLVVLLCFLHIAVTVVFYVRSFDFRLAFVQNQQSSNNIPKIQNNNPVVTSGLEPAKDGDKVSEEGEVLEQPVTKLEKCPETSPLLGKTSQNPGSEVQSLFKGLKHHKPRRLTSFGPHILIGNRAV